MKGLIAATLLAAAAGTMDCGTSVEKTQEHWCRVYAPTASGAHARVSYFVTDMSNGMAEVQAEVKNPDGSVVTNLCSGLSASSDSGCYVGDWRVSLDRSTQFGHVDYIGGNPYGASWVASCSKTTGADL
jgi:hypothetical protein